MGVDQLGEKFNQIHHSSIKSAQVIGKIAAEGVKNLSQAHTTLANHVAKNIQMTAANMMTAKNPEDIWAAMKGNGSVLFSEELRSYQESIQKALNDYTHEFSEVNDDLFEDAKDGLSEFFKLACQNAPDGAKAFIQPYQSACNACFEGAQKMQHLMKECLDNVEGSISRGNLTPHASQTRRKKD